MADRLYRSRDDRMLAGVAGGVAEMLDADPSIIRIAWVLLIFLTGGIALVVYIVMAIVVPGTSEIEWLGRHRLHRPARPARRHARHGSVDAGPCTRGQLGRPRRVVRPTGRRGRRQTVPARAGPATGAAAGSSRASSSS